MRIRTDQKQRVRGMRRQSRFFVSCRRAGRDGKRTPAYTISLVTRGPLGRMYQRQRQGRAAPSTARNFISTEESSPHAQHHSNLRPDDRHLEQRAESDLQPAMFYGSAVGNTSIVASGGEAHNGIPIPAK